MIRKTGKSYEANLQISFESEKQAKDFASKGTAAGERVTYDLEDPEVQELFETGGPLICEIIYPDAFDEAVQKEIDAAMHCGAELELAFSWADNA